ncbi:MAG: hypothetical protein ACK560_01120 [Bacteroidota bacterium]
MKTKSLLALAFLLTMSLSTFAQNASETAPATTKSNPGNPPPRPKAPKSLKAEPILKRMTADLTLTPEQQTKIKVVLVEREKTCGTNACSDQQLKDYNKKINDLLTPDQVKRRNELWKKRNVGTAVQTSDSAY